VERYIRQCIESILSQTFADIEIIAVNDGSTDGTLEALREYESGDGRLKVIDKSNGGYGESVNMGIASSAGKYLGIVESDDFIAETMYETLLGLSFGGTCDIVKGNFWDFYAPGEAVPEAVANSERSHMPDVEVPFDIRQRPEILWGHPSVWSAIYRRAFLEEQGIKLIEAKGGGWVDNPFFFETLCKARRVMWTKEPLYYYRKTNPNSSSAKQEDISLPFARMMDNLDILEKNSYGDSVTLRHAYARALMYMRGAFAELKYDENFDRLNALAKELMQRLDPDIFHSDFNLHDQYSFHTFASPLKYIRSRQKKVLIYNWLPFDNPWNFGGGVNIYCRNLVDTILKERPDVTVYFLSSGFAYSAKKAETYYRMLGNIFGDRCHAFEIVNSPVPAEQRNLYANPSVALESPELKSVFAEFVGRHGKFEAIHFNNIEGLSLDVFDLKKDYPETKFIFSVHNYIPICITGFYFQRHKHRVCSPSHTAEDCMRCTRMEIEPSIERKTYDRAKFGLDPSGLVSFKRFSAALGLARLDQGVEAGDILAFARTATAKLGGSCDHILAVSRRVRDICVENGFPEDKTVVSYIGTAVATRQVRRSLAPPPAKGRPFKLAFLGSDLNHEEKGYPFLLDSLEQLEMEYASRMDVVLTCKTAEHAEIYAMLKNFHSVKVVNGYAHEDLGGILAGVHLGVVPVLWEDNLPQIAIEMAAYGVPVLSSSAGGASELSGCELFKFESGSAGGLLARLRHFVDSPADLDAYWERHGGLVTMKQHWQELSAYYGLGGSPPDVRIPVRDYSFLLMENDFLHKHISLNEAKFTPNPALEDLRKKLGAANAQVESLQAELREAKKRMRGKVVFHSAHEPYQGNVGANLLRIAVEKYDYSNFYAEIKFMLLRNVGPLISDVLSVSGTYHNETGEYKLHIHQLEWEGGNEDIMGRIYFYCRENALYVFAGYPERYSGFAYDVVALVNRDVAQPAIEALNSGYITKNEPRPDDALNSFKTARRPEAPEKPEEPEAAQEAQAAGKPQEPQEAVVSQSPDEGREHTL
jgi:glycosyltransferase involved in cell wall biosynthesis